MDVALKYYLRAQGSYVQGAPVIIGFSIENLSAMDVWLLKWYTPLEGIKGKIFEATCDGVDIPYEGRLMKRGNPETGDYVRLHPGGSASSEFDVSSVYALPACKECKLEFKGRIHDVVFDQRQIPRAADEHLSVELTGDAVSFSIVAGSPQRG
jgi:peptidyl-Lys metalloendopeptidase